jgi:hypothetical protein
LAIAAVVIYFAIDAILRRVIAWQPESDPSKVT